MAEFNGFEDDDYGDLFITQSSNSGNEDGVVSLEEKDEFRSVLDPNYSDVSDFEEQDEAIGR